MVYMLQATWYHSRVNVKVVVWVGICVCSSVRVTRTNIIADKLDWIASRHEKKKFHTQKGRHEKIIHFCFDLFLSLLASRIDSTFFFMQMLTLTYIYIFFYLLRFHSASDNTHVQMCQTRSWMLSMGFTLSYGAMFSKVWRVHRFATKQKQDPKVCKKERSLTFVSFVINGVIVQKAQSTIHEYLHGPVCSQSSRQF